MENEKVKIIAEARFKFRSDTLNAWETVNPVLLSGEPGVVTGLNTAGDGLSDPTKYIKFGDGLHCWSDLPWWYGPKGDAYSLTDTDKDEIATQINTYVGDRVGEIEKALDSIISIQNKLGGDVL